MFVLIGLFGMFGYAGAEGGAPGPRSLQQAARRGPHLTDHGPGGPQPLRGSRLSPAHGGPPAVRLIRGDEPRADPWQPRGLILNVARRPRAGNRHEGGSGRGGRAAAGGPARLRVVQGENPKREGDPSEARKRPVQEESGQQVARVVIAAGGDGRGTSYRRSPSPTRFRADGSEVSFPSGRAIAPEADLVPAAGYEIDFPARQRPRSPQSAEGGRRRLAGGTSRWAPPRRVLERRRAEGRARRWRVRRRARRGWRPSGWVCRSCFTEARQPPWGLAKPPSWLAAPERVLPGVSDPGSRRRPPTS